MLVNRKQLSTSRSRRRLGAGLVASTLAAVGMPLTATPASAAINSPPIGGHSIISFPARDFISADGYTPGALTTVNVLRGGTQVGTAVTPADSAGLVEINHPGGGCWTGVTPNIQAGDVIQVLTAPGIGDQTRTAGVTVTQNATKVDASTFTVKGNAISATGGQIPIDQLESRVVANKQAFVTNGRRTLRADAFGAGDGTFAYDGPGATSWTATFTGMGGVSTVDHLSDVDRAVASESRVLWLGANPASGQEVTIYESGGPTPAAKGPAAPCGAAAAPSPSIPDMTSVTDLGTSSLDNLTSNARPNFIGVTGDPAATSATLFVDDLLNATAPVVSGRYSLTPNAALSNGVHTIKVSESSPTAPDSLSAGFLSITIDTTKPTATAHTPALNATSVVQAGNLTAKFSENVTAIGGATFTLKRAATATRAAAAVAAVASYNATTHVATLNPTANLLAATKYTATLTAGIKDAAGNALTASSWSFSTGPAPTVIKKSPAANVLGVSRTANAAARFSENVRGVNGTTFRLRKTSTGAAVSATVSYNATTKVTILNPGVTLAANSLYTLVLSSGITDADGNHLASTSWRFTTGR